MVGPDDLDRPADGVPRAVVSWSALGMAPKDAAQAVRFTEVSGLTVDYWVDTAGLLRQLRTSITVHDVPGTTRMLGAR